MWVNRKTAHTKSKIPFSTYLIDMINLLSSLKALPFYSIIRCLNCNCENCWCCCCCALVTLKRDYDLHHTDHTSTYVYARFMVLLFGVCFVPLLGISFTHAQVPKETDEYQTSTWNIFTQFFLCHFLRHSVYEFPVSSDSLSTRLTYDFTSFMIYILLLYLCVINISCADTFLLSLTVTLFLVCMKILFTKLIKSRLIVLSLHILLYALNYH